MAFDGVRWSDASLVEPYLYTPHAPMTGPVLGRSLLNAYYQSRKGSRLVLQQVYAWNEQRSQASGAGGTGTQIQSVSFVDVSESYARVDDDFTHIRCSVLFVCIADADTVADHRIVVNDGSTTVTGATFTISVQASSVGSLYGTLPRHGEEFFRDVYRGDAEVSLSGLSLPNTLRITVQSRGANNGTSTARAYRPLSAAAWAEIVD